MILTPKLVKTVIGCLLTFFSTVTLNAQDKEPEISLVFLAHDNISEVNIDQTPFIESFTTYIDYLKREGALLSSSQKVAIQVTVHPKEQATIQCFTSPENREIEQKVLNDLNVKVDLHTKLIDFPILLTLNCKSLEESRSFEGFQDPSEKEYKDFEKANLKEKSRLLKTFAISELLPVVGAYETKVDDRFLGVKKLGQLVESTNFNSTVNVIELTDKNSDYWRATLEMESGNQLIPLTKIGMFVSQGEFDYAKRYLEITEWFSNAKTTSDYYINELKWRFDLFYQELSSLVKKGITENDAERYDEALSIYKDVLEAHPNSAWALYENYFTTNKLLIKNNEKSIDDHQNWYEIKEKIYSHNPVYDVDVHLTSGKDAYLFSRRQEILKLFQSKSDQMNDLYTYAEIATDLNAFGMAAQFFWFTANYNKEKQQDAINYFLYCLHQLGNSDIQTNFKGDHDKVFSKIDVARKKAMEKSPYFKMMKN